MLIKWVTFLYINYVLHLMLICCLQSIISQLMEHHVHLPERFGSYELVEWKVEPQIKRYLYLHSFTSCIKLFPISWNSLLLESSNSFEALGTAS